MKQLIVINFSLDMVLSNKYFEVGNQCLEPKIFNKKAVGLF